MRLFKRKMSKINDTYIQTFTKKWINRILWCGVIWISTSYVLAFMGRTEIAESLSKNIAKIIIASTLGYLTKSFFETYSEKKNELKHKELDNKSNNEEE